MAEERRNADRVEISVPALVRLPNGSTWVSTIKNASSEGSVLSLKRSSDAVSGAVQPGETLILMFTIPGYDQQQQASASVSRIDHIDDSSSELAVQFDEPLATPAVNAMIQLSLNPPPKPDWTDPHGAAVSHALEDDSVAERRHAEYSSERHDSATQLATEVWPDEPAPAAATEEGPLPLAQRQERDWQALQRRAQAPEDADAEPTLYPNESREAAYNPAIHVDQRAATDNGLSSKVPYLLLGLLILAVAIVQLLGALGDKDADNDVNADPDTVVENTLPAPVEELSRPFSDCPTCPRLTVIMPSAASGLAPFAMAVTEVTRAQFAAFVSETGHRAQECQVYSEGKWQASTQRSWADPGFEQTPEHPVTCVSWEDAQLYVAWLSNSTGLNFQLPSKLHWDQAWQAPAAGTTIVKSMPCQFGNVADATAEQQYPGWKHFDCADGYVHTAPTASLMPNALGIYDLQGNVVEWLQDCWSSSTNITNETLAGAASNEQCAERQLRGGSWFSPPEAAEFDYDNHQPANLRASSIGIRVIRSIDNE